MGGLGRLAVNAVEVEQQQNGQCTKERGGCGVRAERMHSWVFAGAFHLYVGAGRVNLSREILWDTAFCIPDPGGIG